jgi:thiamine-phosphate pyrophosphorylase
MNLPNGRKDRLQRMRLYLVTGDRGDEEQTLRIVQGALDGGADVVQLRKKEMSKGPQYRLASSLRGLTRSYGALLIINDHADIAIAVDADGVHLGQDDLPVAAVRGLPGFAGRIIGCSTHSLEQALRAVEAGADYLGVGPVHPTPTKQGRRAVGAELVREVAAAVRVPFVAIGGIEPNNVAEVIEAGARAVAVVRSIYDAPDPEAAARDLRARLVLEVRAG